MTEKKKDNINSERAAKGGNARAERLSKERKSEIARTASLERWAKKRSADAALAIAESSAELPKADWRGSLSVGGMEVPCYVLSSGERIIGRTSATELLTGIKGGGALEKYIGVNSLKPFLNYELTLERFVAFSLPEVEGLGKAVMGLRSDALIEICRAFVQARDAEDRGTPGVKLTPRQREMAGRAGMFLAGVAKTGLDALIDEVTGYQYARPYDDLTVRLRLYLSEEMRAWEKTFPDDLWVQFGRLTNWKGPVSSRPKYWGKLVNELIYDYLDPDVSQWLRENAPAPKHGKNYHQWLSEQYGLRKLMETIWRFIGVAGTCTSLSECKQKWAEMNGRVMVQFRIPFAPF